MKLFFCRVTDVHRFFIFRYDVNSVQPNEKPNNIIRSQPLSKSSDWTEVDLEVPEKEEHVHLRNPKLSIIFNNENGTPTPPPRKHKKNFREKIEAVAKTGLQAFQSKKPAEEPICIAIKMKLKIEKNKTHPRHTTKKSNKENKRKKNLSVVSLPNYNELKLTVADFDDIDKETDAEKSNNSVISLPTPADIESDDSFGGLEDWDLGLIEHYNPKDASLPRPRKIQRNSKDMMSDIESLIVKEEDIEKPKVPIRQSESLVKKINREASEVAHKRSSEILNKVSDAQKLDTSKNTTPPPSPVPKPQERLFLQNLPTKEDGKVEHSSLMRILEQFSIRDKQDSLENESLQEINDNVIKVDENSTKNNSNQSSLTPSLLEFEKNIAVNSIEDFINAEKINTDTDLNFGKYNVNVIS
ncbi:hypothetical protein NQ314_009812 [Rhamnusium bicolor]|uniref:Uncharacterized protein n=1 Tax=Rhamnusium bicolor TaxID=1586634 RepID=A0AAV8XVT0_9CUCU|nr:hypothetical protein NQ314_009812 [Rhamnusium bicolor]